MAAAKKATAKKRTKATPTTKAKSPAPTVKKTASSKTKPTNAANDVLAQSNARLTVLVALFAGLSIVFAALAFYWYA